MKIYSHPSFRSKSGRGGSSPRGPESGAVRLLAERPESLAFFECLTLLLDPEGADEEGTQQLCKRLLGMTEEEIQARMKPPIWGEMPSSAPFGLLEATWHQRIRSGDISFHALREELEISEAEWLRISALAELCRRYGAWWIRSLLPKSLGAGFEPALIEQWLKTPPHHQALWSGERLQGVLKLVPESCRRTAREWIGVVIAHSYGPGDFHLLELGGRNRVYLEASDLFGQILGLRPTGFFLFHNHPNGRLESSDSDLKLTRAVAQLGNKLGVPLLGHGIVSPLGERWLAVIRPSAPQGPQAMSEADEPL